MKQWVPAGLFVQDAQSAPLPKSHPVNVWQMCGINSWLLFHVEGQNLYFLSWFCRSKRSGGQIENIPGVGNKASIPTKSVLQGEPGSECSRERAGTPELLEGFVLHTPQ